MLLLITPGDEYCQTQNPEGRYAIVNGWTDDGVKKVVLIFISTEDLETSTRMLILAQDPLSDDQEFTDFTVPFSEGRYSDFSEPDSAYLTSVFENEINATLVMERGL